jgi:hypothetical protein
MPSKDSQGSERDSAGSGQARVSDERLIALFSRPQTPKQLIAGLRVLGFSATSVQTMTGAKSRDVVYSWAAGRARPGEKQARRLDEIRRTLYFICRHAELGPDSAWMLFNAKFADMDPAGPTVMELIAQGRSDTVMGYLEELVGDDRNGGGEAPPEEQPPEPPPTTERDKRPVGSGR